jgi:hypothetical protein
MSAFYQAVDKAFYEQAAANNGGELPDDLKDSGGAPRKLDPKKPSDAGYIKSYKALLKSMTPSAAVPKVRASQPACVLCGGNPMSPPLDPSKECRHESLIVRCDHKGRKVEIQDMREYVELQVVAGPDKEPDTIVCETKLVEGPCDLHTDRVLDVTPQLPLDMVKSSTSQKLEFEARSTPISADNFFKYFWPTGPDLCTHYRVTALTCMGDPLVVPVVAYPDIAWDVSIEGGVELTTDWVKKRKKRRRKRSVIVQEEEQVLSIKPQVKWTYDGIERTLALEGSSESDTSPGKHKGLRKVLNVMDWVSDKVAHFLPMMFQLTDTECTLKSNVKFGGKWNWEELDDSPYCGFGGEVSLEFDPLLEIGVEQDITDLVLEGIGTACPALRPAVIVLRKWRRKQKNVKEKYDDLDAGGYVIGEIKLSVSGAVGFSLSWEKEHGQPAWKGTSASGSLKIGFGAESTLEAKGKFEKWDFTFFAEATLKAAAEAEVSYEKIQALVKDQHDLYLSGILKFNGLTFRGVAMGGFGASIATKEDDAPKQKSKADADSELEVGVDFTESSEDTATAPDGTEYTKTKSEVKQGDKFTTDGGEYSVEGTFEWTPDFLRPRIWNFTDEKDDDTGAEPLGPWCIINA